MPLDQHREFVLTIDSRRSVTVTPSDEQSIVLLLEDPHSVAIVEMTMSQVDELIDGLKNLRTN